MPKSGYVWADLHGAHGLKYTPLDLPPNAREEQSGELRKVLEAISQAQLWRNRKFPTYDPSSPDGRHLRALEELELEGKRPASVKLLRAALEWTEFCVRARAFDRVPGMKRVRRSMPGVWSWAGLLELLDATPTSVVVHIIGGVAGPQGRE